MAKPKVSPLHKVIDAARWDAEPPLGRLVIVVHAAFLDAGFVLHGATAPKSGRLPKRLGRTASTLSLWYTTPQLLHRWDADPAVLRLRALGRNVVFYVQYHTRINWFFPAPQPPDTYWLCLDALAAAPLLSGGLDDTGHALRNDARMAALWNALSEGLCRRLLVDMCRRFGVAIEPTFMSLPGDVKVAILGRLIDGDELAMVESTCTELRRLVADHDEELWKPRFEALSQSTASGFPPDDDDDGAGAGDSKVSSWKARYMRANRTGSWLPSFPVYFSWRRFVHYETATMMRRDLNLMRRDQNLMMRDLNLMMRWFDWKLPSRIRPRDRSDSPERGQAADAVPGRMRRREMAWIAGHGRSRTAAADGHKKKRHGAAAIHSPSSRYRWKHR